MHGPKVNPKLHFPKLLTIYVCLKNNNVKCNLQFIKNIYVKLLNKKFPNKNNHHKNRLYIYTHI